MSVNEMNKIKDHDKIVRIHGKDIPIKKLEKRIKKKPTTLFVIGINVLVIFILIILFSVLFL